LLEIGGWRLEIRQLIAAYLSTIQFYTSDITGAFKIIVQGVAGKDVVYGGRLFTVNK
jgi:hypothetical protein